MRYNLAFYTKYKIKVTEDPIRDPSIDNKQRNFESDIHSKLNSPNRNTSRLIAEIERGLERYPKSKALHNYLFNCYKLNKEEIKAERIVNATVVEFPDYVFGKMAKAVLLMENGKFEEASAILGEPRDVRNLEREDFIHSSIFMHYYEVATKLAIKKEDAEDARKWHKMMFDYNVKDQRVRSLGFEINLLEMKNSPLFNRKQNLLDKAWQPAPNSRLNTSTEAPAFFHPQINQFYEFDIEETSREFMDEIMALPHDTLIEDLEMVVKDAMGRFEHHQLDEQYYSLNHALFFLSALKSEKSLPLITEILCESDEFQDFWFGDFVEWFLQPALFHLGQNQIGQLLESAKVPYRDGFFTCWGMSAAVQIALQIPEKRQEVIAECRGLLNYYFENEHIEGLINPDLMGMIIHDVSNLRATELLPLIEQIYAKETWVDLFAEGDYNDVVKKMNEPLELYNIEPQPLNIYEYYDKSYLNRRAKPIITEEEREKYEKILSPTDKYDKYKQDLSLEMLKMIGGSDDDDDDDEEYYVPQAPIKRLVPKVGRNEKCPCGSGSKYKKCCGK
jgi:hypothetical protein